MRIGYFADGPWSHKALKKIVADKSLGVAFICARHESPDALLKAMATDLCIPYVTFKDVNTHEAIAYFKEKDCDLFVSMSFNQIFKRELASLPHKKTINCHAGKLPYYRGRNVLNWVLINDEREFGITLHYIDESIDTGDIIVQRCFPIEDSDDYQTLLNRCYVLCADILIEGIKLIQFGKQEPKSQTSVHPVGFYCPRRRLGDEKIDWSWSSRDVFNYARPLFARAACYNNTKHCDLKS